MKSGQKLHASIPQSDKNDLAGRQIRMDFQISYVRSRQVYFSIALIAAFKSVCTIRIQLGLTLAIREAKR
jgi:hypothetical protein